MYLNDIEVPIIFGAKCLAGKTMAVFKQFFRRFENHSLHSKTNGSSTPQTNGASKSKVNGTVTLSKGDEIAPNVIETTVKRLDSASSELNAFLRKRQITVSSDDRVLDVPLTDENASFHESKSAILDSAEKLVGLLKSPRDVVLSLSFQHCATASLQIIMRYRLHHQVPLSGSISYKAMATALNETLTASLLERILKHAISFGLFAQPSPGLIAHNSASAELVKDSDLEAWVYLCACVAYPAGAVIPKAFDQYGVSSEADEAAYGVSIGRKVGQFARFREPDGQRDFELFAKAMKGVSKGGAYDSRHVLESGFPWSKLGKALIVDVGGGPGHVSIALARTFPSLTFEVQDLPETVEVGANGCPEELKSRVSYKAHNFFEEQPQRFIPADETVVYFLRFILHDWSDKYAQQILAPVAKAMRPQDRLILNEAIVPEPGERSPAIEKGLHDRDLLMLMNLNGRERPRAVFEELLAACDPPLCIAEVHEPPEGELVLIEARLKS